ncbi:MAG: tetratricopeptide repeat protein [Candidatus Omnitrophica bacterium]|nr:tetratricopeptide repeat protein [Candidatus Omnitrophota bacterium]MBU1870211.1 tetratricopeptide repeat protein [Candidatus Omnitrophota bacterium]
MRKVTSCKSQRYKKLFVLSLVFIFLGLGLLSPCFAQDPAKEEEAIFVAKKAFSDGFYEVSLGLLERFIKNYPDSPRIPEAELMIGECLFHQGRYFNALNKFEGLLNKSGIKEIKDGIYYWIAEVHFKGNNFNKAQEYYGKVIKEFPESGYIAPSLYSLGWCFLQQNNFSEALKYFKAVEEKFPKEQQTRDASFKIIECLYNLKDYEALKERAKSYLKLFSGDSFRLPYFYFYLAEADYYLNNFNDAIEGYSKVISGSTDEKIQALSELGIAWSLLKLKKFKEAEDAFSVVKTANLDKRSSDVYYLGKAILCMETNKVNEASKIYGELLKTTSDPQVLMQCYLGRADALYNLADYKEAVDVYKEALQKAENRDVPGEIMDKLHSGLSWAYLKQGEFKEGIKEFRKIVKTSDDKIVKVSALCQIGDAYQDSGDFLKAEETYDTILRDYPDSFYSDYVQYQLGLTLLKASNYDGAIMSFLALKKNYPQSKMLDDAAYALGLAYFQKQDYNASREVFERFQSEFNDSNLKSQALYLLGTSLYNTGKYNEAIEAFKNIIRFYEQDSELVQKAEYEIADCFYQLGNEKEAMSRFKVLRSKYPDSKLTAEIIWWLGEYYYRHNDLTLARRYFGSLIQDFPKSNLVPDAYYALGSSYEEESNHDAALENFKKVIESGRSDLAAQAAIVIADIYNSLDKPDSALANYENVSNEYPNLNNLIYPKMADLFLKTGDAKKAAEFYGKSLDIVPAKEMANIQLKLAESWEALGEPQRSIEEYLKVTYLYSDNNKLSVKALLRVARIYEDKGDLKEALNIYRRVLEMNTEEAKFAQERIDWIKANTK